MFIGVAMASIVTTPLLKPREYGFIGWVEHLTLVSTNRSMTFENAGSSKMGRCVLSFFGIGIILPIFHLVGSLPSVNDWFVIILRPLVSLLLCWLRLYQYMSTLCFM